MNVPSKYHENSRSMGFCGDVSISYQEHIIIHRKIPPSSPCSSVASVPSQWGYAPQLALPQPAETAETSDHRNNGNRNKWYTHTKWQRRIYIYITQKTLYIHIHIHIHIYIYIYIYLSIYIYIYWGIYIYGYRHRYRYGYGGFQSMGVPAFRIFQARLSSSKALGFQIFQRRRFVRPVFPRVVWWGSMGFNGV